MEQKPEIYDLYTADLASQNVLRKLYKEKFNRTPNAYLNEFSHGSYQNINIKQELQEFILGLHTEDKDYEINVFEKHYGESMEKYYILIYQKDDIILCIDFFQSVLKYEIYYTDTLPQNIIDKIEEVCKKYKDVKVIKTGFNLFLTRGGSPTLYFNEIKDDYQISVEDNYNDDFKQFSDDTIDKLKVTNTSNLFLFHGEPGCGKTHYIRHLIKQLCDNGQRVIYFPQENISFLSNPEFLNFIREYQESVLVVEDAENLLVSREFTHSNPALSNILNLTDGLMSDFLKLKFVCTFNTEISKIDSALLRKGRITGKYEFKKLDIDKANILLKKHGKNHVTKEPMKLTDVYNFEDESYENKKIASIGFGK